MNFADLKAGLQETRLFSGEEIDGIMGTIGQASVGAVVVAAQTLGMMLTSNDVDIIIQHFGNNEGN